MKWAFVRYEPRSSQMMTASYSVNKNAWENWNIAYTVDKERVKRLIEDRANNYYDYDSLCSGLTIDMHDEGGAAYLSALYITRFFDNIEELHGKEIHQVYDIFGGNKTEIPEDCEECKNRGYVSMLEFHYPCSVCHPDKKNERFTSVELREFLGV